MAILKLQGLASLQGNLYIGAPPVEVVATGIGCWGVALDSNNYLYIAGGNNDARLRKEDTNTFILSTIAGTGVKSYGGDNGQATSALINTPFLSVTDSNNNVYFSDSGNNRIRKITVATGIITTIAGTGTAGYNGDNILATTAQINGPRGLTFDTAGNLYFADSPNHRVRKIDTSGIITTIAGTGTAGFYGDTGAATSAQVSNPSDVKLDNQGNIYIADTGNNRIRKINVSNGIINTVVGDGTATVRDNVSALSTGLNQPYCLAFDPSNSNLYISNYNAAGVYAVNQNTQIGTIFAGSLGGGKIRAIKLDHPIGVTVDANTNYVYIGDSFNNRVVRVNLIYTR